MNFLNSDYKIKPHIDLIRTNLAKSMGLDLDFVSVKATTNEGLGPEGNEEGIIVQSDNGPTYKIKPLITLDAVVVGFSEGEGSRANKLKEVLLALQISENEYLTIAKVGNGFTDEQRDSIFKELEKQKVDSDYVEFS